MDAETLKSLAMVEQNTRDETNSSYITYRDGEKGSNIEGTTIETTRLLLQEEPDEASFIFAAAVFGWDVHAE